MAGLLAGSFLAGSTAASAVESLTITTPADDTTASTLDVAGDVTWSPYSGYLSVSVSNSAGTTVVCDSVYYESSGAWTCASVGLAVGSNTITASARDEGSESAATTTSITVNRTAEEEAPDYSNVLACTFRPGGITVTSDVVSFVGLYGVGGPGAYTPTNLALCSGMAGTSSPGPFDDTLHRGTCYSSEGSGGSGGEGEGGGATFPGVLESGCQIDNLTPGIWNLYYESNDGNDWDWFFTVPAAPQLVAQSTSVLAGTGTPGNTVRVVTSTSDDVICSAVVDSQGQWSCAIAPPVSETAYRAFDVDAKSGGISAYSTTVTVSGTVAPPGISGSSTRVPQGGTFTLSGSKTDSASIAMTILVSGKPFATFAPCNGAGTTWSCTYSTARLGLAPGSYELEIRQSVGSTVSEPVAPRPRLVVTAVTTADSPPPATTPEVLTPSALSWTLTITGVDGPLRPGQTVGLSSSGLPPDTVIDAELHSTPVRLGGTTVGADGTFDLTVRIPMDVEPGQHEIVVTATPPGYLPSPVMNPVTIQLDDEPKAVADTIPHDDPRVLAASAGGTNPRNDPNSPTAITRTIPTLFDILTSPATVGIAAGLALVILLLVALPAEILNATIESNTSRFGRGFAAIQGAIDRVTTWLTTVTRTPVVASALLIVITSVIFGFVDPGFGFDLASLRLVLSLALGLFVVTFVASRLTGVVVGRRWSLGSEIGMQPAALIFAAVGVILARLLDFSPGFLIGLVIGLELAHRATDLQRVKAIVIEFSFIVGLGVLAWLLYSASVALQGDSDIGFVGGLAQDALVAVTSEGLTAVMVAMIPIAFLDGKKIFDASKKLWVVMFLVVATAFSLLVLPTALSGQETGNIVWWVVVLVGFAVVTVGVTFWLRATGHKAPAIAAQKVDA